MKQLFVLQLAALLVLAVFAASAQTGALAKAAAGNVQEGQRLNTTTGCYQCHGYVGQGGSAGTPLASTSSSFEDFRDYCRRPGGSMPPYTSKVLSDRQLADLYAFVKSLPAPTPRKSIPLLEDK